MSAYLETQSSLAGLDRQIDEDCLQGICSRVADWIVGAKEGGESLTIPAEKTVGEFTVHAELRQRFPESLWTQFADNGRVQVIKVSKERRKELEFEDENALKEKTLDFLTGFSRVRLMQPVFLLGSGPE